MRKIFCLFFILFSVQTAFAGLCLERKPSVVDFYQSEAVFIGKILSIKSFKRIPDENENRNVKFRTVEFEVQKSYKGAEGGKKISVINAYHDIDWKDLKLKKGQTWAVHARRNKDNLFFGTGCDPWSEQIMNQTDFDKWNGYFDSQKTKIETDKQVITGSIFDENKYQAIENANVIIKGNDLQITAETDKDGIFYVPVKNLGTYLITIEFPMKAFFFYSSLTIEKEQFEELLNKKSFTYQINLKNGEFNYQYVHVGLYK